MNIIEILSIQRKGRCLTEAEEKLQELVKQVSKTGKSGILTLKIKITPKEGTVELHDDVDVKMPKPDKFGTVFYPDEKTGLLFREDPLQPELPNVTTMEDAASQ